MLKLKHVVLERGMRYLLWSMITTWDVVAR
jgi:hypothetical protein